MILNMIILLGFAWAQDGPSERFGRLCNQLNTPQPSERIQPNRSVVNLMAVVDFANGTKKKMDSAISRGLMFDQWKAEANTQGLVINDHFHLRNYRQALRLKCAAQITESGTGLDNEEAYNQPTEEQYGRRVDDVTGPGTSSGGSTGSTSDATE